MGYFSFFLLEIKEKFRDVDVVVIEGKVEKLLFFVGFMVVLWSNVVIYLVVFVNEKIIVICKVRRGDWFIEVLEWRGGVVLNLVVGRGES